MATDIYDKGMDNIGQGNISLQNDTINILLVDTSIYSVDLSIDEFQSVIPSSAIIAERTLNLTTFQNRVFDDYVIKNNDFGPYDGLKMTF